MGDRPPGSSTQRRWGGTVPVSARAASLIELVEPSGRRIGYAPKSSVHRPPGTLHRAASALLLDQDDRLLLQRRALGKYHSGGRWTNTACGHPLPGEHPRTAARRCLQVELGLDLRDDGLVDAGVISYHVVDLVSGLVEKEFDDLFAGRLEQEPSLKPLEVAEVAAVDLEDPQPATLAAVGFSAWYGLVLTAAMPTLTRVRGT